MRSLDTDQHNYPKHAQYTDARVHRALSRVSSLRSVQGAPGRATRDRLWRAPSLEVNRRAERAAGDAIGEALALVARHGGELHDCIAADRAARREDPALAQQLLEHKRDCELLGLACDLALTRQEEVLGQLLGQGAASLNQSTGYDVSNESPSDTKDVDPEVIKKALILDRNHGVLRVQRNAV